MVLTLALFEIGIVELDVYGDPAWFSDKEKWTKSQGQPAAERPAQSISSPNLIPSPVKQGFEVTRPLGSLAGLRTEQNLQQGKVLCLAHSFIPLPEQRLAHRKSSIHLWLGGRMIIWDYSKDSLNSTYSHRYAWNFITILRWTSVTTLFKQCPLLSQTLSSYLATSIIVFISLPGTILWHLVAALPTSYISPVC